MAYVYKTQGTCSSKIEVELEGNVVRNVKFTGGCHGNLQAIRAIGRSDIILILEIIKKSLYLAIILSFIFLSDKPEMLAVTSIVNTVIATVINTFPNRKLIGYRYRMQIMDLLPNLLTAAVMGGAVYAMNFIPMNAVLLLCLQILAGAVIYVLLSIVTRNENFRYFLDMLKKILNKGKAA